MLVWGLSIPATKIALVDFPPYTLTALRYVVAVPCFAVFMRFRPLPPWRDLFAMLADGRIKPLISERYPLARAAEGIAALEARQAVGKLVVEPWA